VIRLGAYDQPGMREAVLGAGADSFLLTRSLGSELSNSAHGLLGHETHGNASSDCARYATAKAYLAVMR